MEKKRKQFIAEMRDLLLDYHRYISDLEQKTEIFFDGKMEKLADKYIDNDNDQDDDKSDDDTEYNDIEKLVKELMKEFLPKKKD